MRVDDNSSELFGLLIFLSLQILLFLVLDFKTFFFFPQQLLFFCDILKKFMGKILLNLCTIRQVNSIFILYR